MRSLLLVVVLSLVTACGGGSDESPSTARTASNGDVYTDADVVFATEMIPHHAEAVQMVVLAQDRPLDPVVRDLANGIRDVQVAEVERMVDWLSAWGEKVPETSLDHSSAHDGGGHSDAMAALSDASDAEFQELWLRLMIEHHEGAVAMAEEQQAKGRFKPALTLARNILRSQQAEIATMQDLLAP